MSTILLTRQEQIDRLHDELARVGLAFPDATLDQALYYGIECVAAEDGGPYRYDFEFGDAAWDRMVEHVLEYLEVDYDVFAGL